MKKIFLLSALMVAVLSPTAIQAGSLKSEEAFDRSAGLFRRAWKKAPKVMRFSTPTPPQVRPVLPPWSQQPQGSQGAPTLITLPPPV